MRILSNHCPRILGRYTGDNFYSWIFVAVCFSICARFVLHQGRTIWLLLVPGLAYLMLLVSFVAVGVFQFVAQLETEQQDLTFFLALLLVCFACMFFFRTQGTGHVADIPPVYSVARIAIHVYFLAAAGAIGLYRAIPYLLVVSLVALALEILIHFWVREARSSPGSEIGDFTEDRIGDAARI